MLWLCRIVGPLGLEALNYLNLLNHARWAGTTLEGLAGLNYLNRGELSNIEPLNLLNGSIFFVDRDLGCHGSML